MPRIWLPHGLRYARLSPVAGILTDQPLGLTGLCYVTESLNGTSNITNMNFFLDFNEHYSQLLSISATQVVESSIFVPIPGGDLFPSWLALSF